MRFWRKFVAGGTMAIVMLLPLVSAAVCAPAGNAKMHCPPGCPMMGKMTPKMMMAKMAHHRGTELGANSSPCCKFEQGKRVPPAETKIAPSAVSHEPTMTSTAPVAITRELRESADFQSPPGPRADSQARLCTFLI